MNTPSDRIEEMAKVCGVKCVQSIVDGKYLSYAIFDEQGVFVAGIDPIETYYWLLGFASAKGLPI